MRPGPQPGAGQGTSRAGARAAWGGELPDWVERLAEAADRTTQTAAAKRIGYSGSVVSQVLKRSYAGDLAAVEKAVRGALMGDTLMCPVLDEIATHDCLGHQRKAMEFSAGSSMRVRLYRACRGGCPHSRMGGTS